MPRRSKHWTAHILKQVNMIIYKFLYFPSERLIQNIFFFFFVNRIPVPRYTAIKPKKGMQKIVMTSEVH